MVGGAQPTHQHLWVVMASGCVFAYFSVFQPDFGALEAQQQYSFVLEWPQNPAERVES